MIEGFVMWHRNKLTALCFYSVVLIGCATTETTRILDNDRVSSIKSGITTRTEVEALLGKPSGISTYEVLAGPEEEEWNYYVTREKVSSLLTVVPMALGGVVGVIGVAAEQARSSGDEFYGLSIRFSKEGTVNQVEKCKINPHEYKTTCESY